MRKQSYLLAAVIALSLNFAPIALYAGNDKNPNPNNGSSNSNANKPDKEVTNDKDGNGKGTGQGTGNVPVPADGNNEHGMVNRGGNYNNGVNRNQAEVPFDGGVGILVAATIGVGIKRAYARRKKAMVEGHGE